MTALPLVRREAARLGGAAVVALAVQLLATGVLVPAIADDGSTMPEEVRLPEPEAGDRAVYDVAGGEGQLDQVVATWGSTSWLPLPDGDWTHVRTLQLRLVAAPPAGDHPEFGWNGRADPLERHVTVAVHLDTETGQPLAWNRSVRETQAVDSYGSDEHPDLRVNRTERFSERATHYEGARTPLGFTTDLHEQAMPTNRTVKAVGSGIHADGTELEAAGLAEVDGSLVLRYEATRTDAAVSYAPNVPVPIRVEAPSGWLVPGNVSTAHLVLTLSGFDPGDEPEAATSSSPAKLPPPERRPRRAWGPAGGGFAVDFPVEEAYRALVDEQGEGSVSAFLDEHPDAYVAEAGLHEWYNEAEWESLVEEGASQGWAWRFYLTDGEDSIERFVVREDGYRSSPLAGDPDVRTRSQAPGEYPRPAEHHPRLDAAPERLPIVDDLADRYDRLVDGPTPDRWRITTSCPQADCHEPRTELAVLGVDKEAQGTERTAGSQVQELQNEVASLTVDAQGETLGFQERTRTTEEGHASSVQRSPSATSASPAAPWTAEDVGTLEQTARAGLLATLAGALYYLWPKVKTLGLALYSRIGKDDALDNETREAIFDLVREEPGVHFTRLREELEVGAGQLDHHLKVLVGHGLLEEVEAEGYRCYFETGAVDPRIQEVADRLKADAARHLLCVIARRPEASLSDLADELDVSQPGASYHVDRLSEAGLVDRIRQGARLELQLTDLGRQAIEALDLP